MNNRLQFTLALFAGAIALLPCDCLAQGDDIFSPKVAWEAETTEADNSFGAILLDGDQIIAGDDRGVVRAFDCKTGEIRWLNEHGTRIYTDPIGDGSQIYFASESGVAALSRKDGVEQWLYPISGGAGYCALATKQNYVITGGNDGNIHAIAAENGVEIWTLNIVTDAPPDPPGWDGARARIGTMPARPAGLACDESSAYICIFDQCRIVAIDLKTGKKRWSFQTGGWVSSAPTVSGDSVFVGSQDGHLWRLDKSTGQEIWQFRTEGRADDPITVDSENVYFGSSDGRLYCANAEDGKELWRFETDKTEKGSRSIVASKPLILGELIVVCDYNAKLYWLDKTTGMARSRFEIFDKCEAGGTLYFDGESLFLRTHKTIPKTGKNAIVAVAPAR
jgi:outer membrane protein assembly factor BamB